MTQQVGKKDENQLSENMNESAMDTTTGSFYQSAETEVAKESSPEG